MYTVLLLRALSKNQNWPARLWTNQSFWQWKLIGFFQEFLLKNHLLHAFYLGFDWSGWIVLIKIEILLMMVMVWPVSSDKLMDSTPSIQINVIKPKPKQILRQITRDVTNHVLAFSMEKQMHTTCNFTSDWLRNWRQIFLAIHTQYKTKVITAIVDSQLAESCSI